MQKLTDGSDDTGNSEMATSTAAVPTANGGDLLSEKRQCT